MIRFYSTYSLSFEIIFFIYFVSLSNTTSGPWEQKSCHNYSPYIPHPILSSVQIVLDSKLVFDFFFFFNERTNDWMNEQVNSVLVFHMDSMCKVSFHSCVFHQLQLYGGCPAVQGLPIYTAKGKILASINSLQSYNKSKLHDVKIVSHVPHVQTQCSRCCHSSGTICSSLYAKDYFLCLSVFRIW